MDLYKKKEDCETFEIVLLVRESNTQSHTNRQSCSGIYCPGEGSPEKDTCK